jgi:hypothetical protein
MYKRCSTSIYLPGLIEKPVVKYEACTSLTTLNPNKLDGDQDWLSFIDNLILRISNEAGSDG